MKSLVVLAASAALGGCAAAAPEIHTMSARYNPSEVAWASVPGTNTIEGNAVLRTVSGEVRTCAGLEAALLPVSSYAIERFTTIYGNPQGGFRSSGNLKFSEDDPAYVASERKAICDSQGNFRFTNLADGDYYVRSSVVWGVPTGYYGIVSSQGGFLAQRVSVHGGETKRIVLTNQ
jgi:hypothetical protein